LGEAVIVEAGVRWDSQSQLNDQQTSPRLSILWDLGDRATLRASMGQYYQSQGIDEIQVSDGVNNLFPAQRAEHAILSFEYALGSATSLRAEVYEKRIRNPRPRFENLVNRVSLLPELLPDRVLLVPERARAAGIELSVESDLDDWRWWFSFSRVSVQDYFDNRWMRRSWEEPWSSKGGFIWSGMRWTASTALTVRAGWPISPLRLDGSMLVLSDYNEESFETFKSVDVRAARRIDVKHGSMEAYVEINNVFNFSNPCCIDYALQRNSAGVVQGLNADTDEWLPAIPVFGFLWEF
jgi:outer membrane cobalamin receptor